MANLANIHDITDYIIIQAKGDSGMSLSHLKLQKLLYYVQAWYLANYDEKLFAEDFQAWIHGPVNREIFDRFKETKILLGQTHQNILSLMGQWNCGFLSNSTDILPLTRHQRVKNVPLGTKYR